MTAKRIAVTFSNGLPLGTHATFKHDGEIWIAYPATKDAQIVSVLDRLLGIYTTITNDVVRSMNNHAGNAGVIDLGTTILRSVGRARTLAGEKIKAVTS